MKPSRSRSRNKNRNNSRPSGGNIINRVFDSSGPEGKVRGTPQQIIEKYTQLHRDAVLSGDRVNAENFAQHAEHYTRLLAEAQKDIDAKREEQEQQNRERQAERDRERAERLKAQEEASAAKPAQNDAPLSEPAAMDQPVRADRDDSGLVQTPEEQSAGKTEAPAPRKRRTRKPKATPLDGGNEGGENSTPEAAE